jgi:hypothetical protein
MGRSSLPPPARLCAALRTIAINHAEVTSRPYPKRPPHLVLLRTPTNLPTRQPPRTAWKVDPCSAPVGLREWVEQGHKQVKGGLSVDELYASLARTKLRRRPGERVKYSNRGRLGEGR